MMTQDVFFFMIDEAIFFKTPSGEDLIFLGHPLF